MQKSEPNQKKKKKWLKTKPTISAMYSTNNIHQVTIPVDDHLTTIQVWTNALIFHKFLY